MSEKKIQLQNVEEVKEFVSAAEKCEFDIDVKYNRIIVDAKSFLGVLGLCPNRVAVVSHGEDEAVGERLAQGFCRSVAGILLRSDFTLSVQCTQDGCRPKDMAGPGTLLGSTDSLS